MMNLKLLNSESFEVKRLTATPPATLNSTSHQLNSGGGSADNAALPPLNGTEVYQAIVAHPYGLRSALI